MKHEGRLDSVKLAKLRNPILQKPDFTSNSEVFGSKTLDLKNHLKCEKMYILTRFLDLDYATQD